MNRPRALYCLISLVFSLSASGTPADTLGLVLAARIDTVLKAHGALLEQTQLGLYVYDLTADTPLYAHGHRQRLRPASTQKLFTAVTALYRLGGDYCFTTTLTPHFDTLRTPGAPDSLRLTRLTVRGGMDPFFGAADMKRLARTVKLLCPDGAAPPITYDESFKDTIPLGWGWCWDDDNPSLSPLLYEGRPRFAEALTRALADTTLTAAPDTVTETLTGIDTVLRRMMKHSDNQYAESLFYQLGPTREAAAEQVAALLSAIGVPRASYTVADGSGLSLYNYTTPEALVLLLRYAWQHPNLYRHLQPTLPLAGHDGTLQRRMTAGPARYNVMAKTGSVTGVSTLAGYAQAADGRMLAFAIMNQGVRSLSEGRNFQDAVCQALCAPLVQDTEEDPPVSQDPEPLPAQPDGEMTTSGQP